MNAAKRIELGIIIRSEDDRCYIHKWRGEYCFFADGMLIGYKNSLAELLEKLREMVSQLSEDAERQASVQSILAEME